MSQTPSQHKKVLLTHLDWNLQRLDEVLKQGSSDYFKSAALQRFGYAYVMAIKTIRGFAEIDDGTGDEECVARAIRNGWTEDPSQWAGMTADYKRVNQKPTGREAEVIYQKLPRYLQTFRKLYSRL